MSGRSRRRFSRERSRAPAHPSNCFHNSSRCHFGCPFTNTTSISSPGKLPTLLWVLGSLTATNLREQSRTPKHPRLTVGTTAAATFPATFLGPTTPAAGIVMSLLPTRRNPAIRCPSFLDQYKSYKQQAYKHNCCLFGYNFTSTIPSRVNLEDTDLSAIAFLLHHAIASRMMIVVMESSPITLATAKELSREQAKL